MNNTRSRVRARMLLGGACAAALMTAGLAPALAAPDRGTPAAGHTWHVRVGAQAGHMAIQTMGFYPRHLWVDQGDTVTFDAHSAEIHTVTFLARPSSGGACPGASLCELPQGFDVADPVQSTRGGSGTYDGSSYYTSGILTNLSAGEIPLPPFVTVYRHYSLTFPESLAPGTYHYYCLVHGRAMRGEVIVQAKGTPYPFSQSAYDASNARRIRRDVSDGFSLWDTVRSQTVRNNRGHATKHVIVGAMDDRAMVMRFIPTRVHVARGQRVVFRSTSMGEPHTVTFGDDETGCGGPPCNPESSWNVNTAADGNLTATLPGHNGGYTGPAGDLNSGLLLGLPPTVTGLPQQLTVRFVKDGRRHYTCALHDAMGMRGRVSVG